MRLDSCLHRWTKPKRCCAMPGTARARLPRKVPIKERCWQWERRILPQPTLCSLSLPVYRERGEGLSVSDEIFIAQGKALYCTLGCCAGPTGALTGAAGGGVAVVIPGRLGA